MTSMLCRSRAIMLIQKLTVRLSTSVPTTPQRGNWSRQSFRACQGCCTKLYLLFDQVQLPLPQRHPVQPAVLHLRLVVQRGLLAGACLILTQWSRWSSGGGLLLAERGREGCRRGGNRGGEERPRLSRCWGACQWEAGREESPGLEDRVTRTRQEVSSKSSQWEIPGLGLDEAPAGQQAAAAVRGVGVNYSRFPHRTPPNSPPTLLLLLGQRSYHREPVHCTCTSALYVFNRLFLCNLQMCRRLDDQIHCPDLRSRYIACNRVINWLFIMNVGFFFIMNVGLGTPWTHSYDGKMALHWKPFQAVTNEPIHFLRLSF